MLRKIHLAPLQTHNKIESNNEKSSKRDHKQLQEWMKKVDESVSCGEAEGKAVVWKGANDKGHGRTTITCMREHSPLQVRSTDWEIRAAEIRIAMPIWDEGLKAWNSENPKSPLQFIRKRLYTEGNRNSSVALNSTVGCSWSRNNVGSNENIEKTCSAQNVLSQK